MFNTVGFQPELACPGESTDAQAVCDGWCIGAAEDLRAEGEMQLIHQARTEHGIIQFTAAFADQSFDPPLGSEPFQRRGEIEMVHAERGHFVRNRMQPLESVRRCNARCQDDDRGNAMLENTRLRVQST